MLLGALLSSAVNAQSPGQPVAPRLFFPGGVLNVYAPDAEGWVITGLGSNGISFGKRGGEAVETYGSQVVIFEMPPTDGGEEMVDWVKKRIAEMNPPPRFQETDSSYRYTEDRGYPCVDAHIGLDDKAAVTPVGEKQLKLQVLALYRRHPEQEQPGFLAAYSHRGKTADDQMEAAAKGFIEGVNVPEK